MKFNSSIEKNIFYTLPVILFVLLPFFLITGPFLSDLSVSLISIIFITYCIKKRNFSYFRNKYFYFFLIVWGYLILNTVINNFNLNSFKISFFYFRYAVFVIAVYEILEIDSSFIKYFFYCILLCFSILVIDGFYEYFMGENVFGWKNKLNGRVSSFFGDELILGSYLSRLWPIFFGLSIFLIKRKDKLFIFIMLIFILSEVLIFLSGERVAFFYINLSAIFVIFFSDKLIKLRLITLLVSLSLIVSISYINPKAKERIIDNTISQMNLFDSQNEKYFFSKEHNQLYITSYKIFLDNKILGVGVKNFRIFCSDPLYLAENSCATHPHNTYLQILTETGIIGFIILIFLLGYFLRSILIHIRYKFKKENYFSDFEICLLSGILIYIWPFVPTGNIFNNWLNIISILYFPFLLWSRKFNKSNYK